MSLQFLTEKEVLLLHAQSIEDFGGSHGLRDYDALVSALLAPANRFFYENASIAVCAATYAYHLSQAHAFFDGNKRIAAAAAELFVRDNGFRLQITNAEVVELFLGIAAGQITRAAVEQLFAERIVKAE